VEKIYQNSVSAVKYTKQLLNRLESKHAKLIKEADQIVKPIVAQIDTRTLARHNFGYNHYSTNLYYELIEKEKRRFLVALDQIESSSLANPIVADVGCFIPYLPILLSKIGVLVTVTDTYSLYEPQLKEIILKLAADQNLRIVDADLLTSEFNELKETNTILLMAVVEHLNGSPLPLVRRLRARLPKGGQFIFEVPNIAEIGRRLRLLRGRSPLPPYNDYLESAYPFLGHNREMTKSEVSQLLSRAGLTVQEIFCYNYCPLEGRPFAEKALATIASILPRMNLEGSIMARCSA
jgi:hypothetical protein